MRTVSARPQFEAACQLQSFAGQHSGSAESLYLSEEGSIHSTSCRFRWRDWPNGLGAGLWLQSREFDSLISPQMGGSYKGITHGLQPGNESSSLSSSTR